MSGRDTRDTRDSRDSRTEELLDEVATYADRLADSDSLADTGSMATAEVLAELYEKREWVQEWLDHQPIKERTAYIGGRPPEPDSRNRFAQWLVWAEGQRGRRSPQSRTTYQLLNANEVKGYLRLAQITSERAIRPLDWLRKQRMTNHIPEVERIAVELAGAADQITSVHTREALKLWKHDVLGPQAVKEVIRTSRAQTHRIKAQSAIEQFLLDGDDTEVEKFKAYLAKRGLA